MDVAVDYEEVLQLLLAFSLPRYGLCHGSPFFGPTTLPRLEDASRDPDLSVHGPATVDHDGLSGDKRGGVAGEEGH